MMVEAHGVREAREARATRQEEARAWLRQEGEPCRVKLCGMYRSEDVTCINELLPDMVGFITDFPKSHRSLASEDMGHLASAVDECVRTVSVSVDLPIERVAQNAAHAVDILQLHGHEDDDYLAAVRARSGAGIIQAFRIRTQSDVEHALRSRADMVLLDAGQGSGETFDWDLVAHFGERRPFVLAGGLTPRNVVQAVRELHPWGVDMSSGLESNRLKDPAKMRAAMDALGSLRHALTSYEPGTEPLELS